jgi:hypothetical protein
MHLVYRFLLHSLLTALLWHGPWATQDKAHPFSAAQQKTHRPQTTVDRVKWNMQAPAWAVRMDGARKTAWISWEETTKPKYMGGLGFWDTELFNLALLARHGMENFARPQHAQCKDFQGSLFSKHWFLDASYGSSPSQIWHALIEARDVLAQGLVRRIGDGKSIRIWWDQN